MLGEDGVGVDEGSDGLGDSGSGERDGGGGLGAGGGLDGCGALDTDYRLVFVACGFACCGWWGLR